MRIDETQQEVERTAEEYNDASERATAARAAAEAAREEVARLEAQISESQATLDRVGSQLDGQKKRSADAMRAQYRMEAEGFNLTELIFSSSSLSEFLSNLTYLDHFQELNTAEIKKYTAMKEEYENALATQQTAKVDADAQKAIAEEEEATAVEQEARAEQAMESAKEARVKAQEEAEAEIERRAKELEKVGAIDNNVNWRVTRDQFVEEWTKRIDAYFAGSPMAGCGQACAEAAWDFGVDPRWSPAISTLESGKGRAVPYNTSNNAWGWFANAPAYRTFPPFADGCRAHVEYLGKFYGYTVTLDHARTYCPPNAEKWYSMVVEEMRTI